MRKGRVCESCGSIIPYHEPNCWKCGKMMTYIKIEDAEEYDESDFYSGGRYKNKAVASASSDNSSQELNTSNKSQPSTGVANFVSFMGWVVCVLSIIIFLASIAGSIPAGFLSLPLLVGMFISGLLLVMSGQATKALIENSNYSRQILEHIKKQQ